MYVGPRRRERQWIRRVDRAGASEHRVAVLAEERFPE
jgi:hypothetical protein